VLGAFCVLGGLFGTLGGFLGATEDCGLVTLLNGFTSFALSAMLLLSVLGGGPAPMAGGGVDDFSTATVLATAGL